MKKIIVKNFWLKLLALFLSIITWAYVVGELNKGTSEEKAFLSSFIPYKLQAKEVPIKVNIIGTPRQGYRIPNEQINVKPSSCIIMAPKASLDRISYVTTEEIDAAEYAKPVMKKVRLKPINGISFNKDFFVAVTLPVQKTEELAEERK